MNQGKINAEDVRRKLLEHQLRVTQQRIIIYKELYQTKEHPTAEIIYSKIKDEYPSLSLATVYKTLDIFEKNGLVIKIKTNDDSVHYDANVSFHHHLICSKTNRIIDYMDEDFSELINNYLKEKKINNFDIKNVQLNIFGEIRSGNII